jgi:hypothetical protein
MTRLITEKTLVTVTLGGLGTLLGFAIWSTWQVGQISFKVDELWRAHLQAVATTVPVDPLYARKSDPFLPSVR